MSAASYDELRARVRAADHDAQQLAFLRGQVERLTPLMAEREQAVRVEDRDVEGLGELSLDNLLLRLIGGMESSLARERREAVEARLAYEQVKGELAKLERRIAELAGRAGERARVRAEFERCSAERAAALAARGGPTAERIAELDTRMDGRERRAAVLAEALGACADARDELTALIASLGEAWTHAVTNLFRTRGTAMYGRIGVRTTLNQAHEHLVRAGDALRRLDGALDGTGLHVDLRSLSPELSLADWFLASFVPRWLREDCITPARDRARTVLAAVETLATKLGGDASALEAELARDRRLMEELLAGDG